MEQYDTVVDSTDKAALPRFNAYMAVAIGISMSPETSRFSGLATNLHTAAVKLLPTILQSQEPLDTLHCMLLLAVFSMFNPAGGSTWHLMGFIMTNCIAAGLHKTVISQERLGVDSTYRVEWLFWSVYLMDRWVSLRPLLCMFSWLTVLGPWPLQWVDHLASQTMISLFL